MCVCFLRVHLQFVSSSRDTTLRVWDLAEEVAAVRHAAIMDKSWEEHIIGNTEDVMKPGAPLRLCGAGSRSVMDSLRSAPDTLERQRLVFQFFMVGPHVQVPYCSPRPPPFPWTE